MTDDTERYLVPGEAPEVEPLRKACLLLEKKCEGLERDAILLVPKKRTLSHRTVQLGLGRLLSKPLLKGEPVYLPGTRRLVLRTELTFRDTFTSDVILAVYPTPKMLDQIDGAKYAAAVIVVPSKMHHVRDWQRTWNPRVVGRPEESPEALIENPVVELGLKRLTSHIGGPSPDVTGLDERRAARDLFYQLYEQGEEYDPDSVRAWAVRNGWTPQGADKLREYAQDIKDGRRVRVGSPFWPEDMVEELRRCARGK